MSISTLNKKVLLRELKRHTAPCVVRPGWPGWGYPSWVPLPGYPLPPHPDLAGGGGFPTWVPPLAGYPHPDLAGGVPTWVPLWQGTPHPDLAAGVGGTLPGYPPGRVPPWPGWGGVPYLHTPGRVPPCRIPPGWTWQGTPRLPHGILGNVAKHYGIWAPPLGVDKLTKWNYYLPVVLRTRAVNKPSKSEPTPIPVFSAGSARYILWPNIYGSDFKDIYNFSTGLTK